MFDLQKKQVWTHCKHGQKKDCHDILITWGHMYKWGLVDMTSLADMLRFMSKES